MFIGIIISSNILLWVFNCFKIRCNFFLFQCFCSFYSSLIPPFLYLFLIDSNIPWSSIGWIKDVVLGGKNLLSTFPSCDFREETEGWDRVLSNTNKIVYSIALSWHYFLTCGTNIILKPFLKNSWVHPRFFCAKYLTVRASMFTFLNQRGLALLWMKICKFHSHWHKP